jgi:hypothetical protein
MNGQASSGFNDVVLSFKWQLLVSYGFILAAVGGLHFPLSGSQVRRDARSTKYSKRRKSHESRNTGCRGRRKSSDRGELFRSADTESPKV